MDIKSDPKYLEIPVTELEFQFVGGGVDSVTLFEGDRYVRMHDHIAVTIYHPKTKAIAETIEYYKSTIVAFRTRLGVRKILDKRPIPPPVEVSAQPVD